MLVSAAMLAFVSGVTALFARHKVVWIVLTGVLVNAGTYSLLFWAIQSIPSGVAGVMRAEADQFSALSGLISHLKTLPRKVRTSSCAFFMAVSL